MHLSPGALKSRNLRPWQQLNGFVTNRRRAKVMDFEKAHRLDTGNDEGKSQGGRRDGGGRSRVSRPDRRR